jgi:hypothetical protein
MKLYLATALISASMVLGWRSSQLVRPNRSIPAATLDSIAKEANALAGARHLVLPAVRLPFLLNGGAEADAELIGAPDTRAQSTLYIVFTDADCYKGMADVPFWTALAKEFDHELSVVGVMSGGPPEKLRYLLKRQQVAIPVVHDVTGDVSAAVYRAGMLTPAKVLVDRTGRILRVDGATNGDARSQTQYVTTLGRLVPYHHTATSMAGLNSGPAIPH